MASLTVKDVTIGAGRPKTVVPLMGSTCNDLLARAQQAIEAGADCIEWRADFLEKVHDPHELELVARSLGAALPHTPLIATLRSDTQGGRLAASQTEYSELVHVLVSSASVDVVDIEINMGSVASHALVKDAHRHDLYALVSYHDFERTPSSDWMQRQLLAMADTGADICKLAVMAHDLEDAGRLMQATSHVTRLLEKPVVTMAMGETGTITRLAGEVFGSALTFCSLGASSAPGQVDLLRATTALDALHAALA